MSIETDRLYHEIEDWKKAGQPWMINTPQGLREFLEHNDDVLRDLVKKEDELKELKSTPKCDVRIDWENLRHDVELQDLLNTTRPSGVEFGRKAERAIFEYMLEMCISKIYTWDDYISNGSVARWEWHYGAVRPEGHACVERDFSHLVTMSDGEFEHLVRSAHNKSPNENLVREWRKRMRSLGGLGSVSGSNHGFDAHATKAPFPVPQFNHMPDLYPAEDE